LPNFSFDLIESDKIEKEKNVFRGTLFFENFLEKTRIAKILNRWVKKGMKWKINKNPKTKKPGADIRISDQALIFLPEPKRELLLNKTQKLINNLIT
jgi:hypothetical protein